MDVSFEQICGLVEAELVRDDVPDQRARLTPFLVTPTRLQLSWQYGDGETFEAWLVGRSTSGVTGLVYCTEGVGSRDYPWGAVLLESGDMGMDSGWHAGLAHAAICDGLITAPPGYVVP